MGAQIGAVGLDEDPVEGDACGDVAEETPDPSRMIPKAMRMTIYIGGAAASWGDPDQVAPVVGEREEQQPVFFVLAVVVAAVGGAGPAAGGD